MPLTLITVEGKPNWLITSLLETPDPEKLKEEHPTQLGTALE